MSLTSRIDKMDEWWNRSTPGTLKEVGDFLIQKGLTEDEIIEDVIEKIVFTMKDEYGD